MLLAYWLSLTLDLCLSLLSYTSSAYFLRVCIFHTGLCPPTSIINQENVPTDFPAGQSDRGNFLVEVSPSQVTSLRLVDNKTNQHSGYGDGPLSTLLSQHVLCSAITLCSSVHSFSFLQLHFLIPLRHGLQ